MKPLLSQRFGLDEKRALELEEIHCSLTLDVTSELEILQRIETRADLSMHEKLLLACVTGSAGEIIRTLPEKYRPILKHMQGRS